MPLKTKPSCTMGKVIETFECIKKFDKICLKQFTASHINLQWFSNFPTLAKNKPYFRLWKRVELPKFNYSMLLYLLPKSSDGTVFRGVDWILFGCVRQVCLFILSISKHVIDVPIQLISSIKCDARIIDSNIILLYAAEQNPICHGKLITNEKKTHSCALAKNLNINSIIRNKHSNEMFCECETIEDGITRQKNVKECGYVCPKTVITTNWFVQTKLCRLKLVNRSKHVIERYKMDFSSGKEAYFWCEQKYVRIYFVNRKKIHCIAKSSS